jgi:alkanesulfonate monooxygenase SsuD/methylene tetrahydromethanopterin reductase-like flavin-dependent oxidoreductase (luciferase family)
MLMDVGIGLPNAVRGASGSLFGDWARRSEERGFASLSTIDRLAYPSYDSLVSMALAAGATHRIRLVTGILLAPLYTPPLLAKASASVANMSGGRLTLGIGVGGRPDDFEVAQRQLHTRGRDLDATLEQLHRAWAGEPAWGSPAPVCPPVEGGRVPIMMGGTSDAALRRMVRWGEGWLAGGGGPAMVAPFVQKVRDAWKEGGRDGEPRIGALAYFALGDDAVQAGAGNLRQYYGFLGEYSERVVDGMLTSKAAIQDAINGFADVGVTEIHLDPAAASLEQVDRLADAIA